MNHHHHATTTSLHIEEAILHEAAHFVDLAPSILARTATALALCDVHYRGVHQRIGNFQALLTVSSACPQHKWLQSNAIFRIMDGVKLLHDRQPRDTDGDSFTSYYHRGNPMAQSSEEDSLLLHKSSTFISRHSEHQDDATMHS